MLYSSLGEGRSKNRSCPLSTITTSYRLVSLPCSSPAFSLPIFPVSKLLATASLYAISTFLFFSFFYIFYIFLFIWNIYIIYIKYFLYFYIFVLFLSSSSMHLKFLWAFSGVKSLFLLIAKEYFIVYMYHSWFLYLPIEWHLGCSQVWVSMNKAVINNLCADSYVDVSFSLIWISI